MTARRGPAAYLRLRVGSRHEVAFVPFPARAPMFVIGAAGTLVCFTLARADRGRARGLRPPARGQGVGVRGGGGTPVPGPAPAAGVPVPYTLTAEAEALLAAEPERADLVPLPGGREVTA